MDTARLLTRCKAKEGLSLKPYLDNRNVLTIGYGRNLRDKGISQAEADTLLANDVAEAAHQAASFPWFTSLDAVRQNAVVEMVFNLGLAGFQGFKRTIADLAARDYLAASVHMLDSAWAKQVGGRARELSRMIESGTWPDEK